VQFWWAGAGGGVGWWEKFRKSRTKETKKPDVWSFVDCPSVWPKGASLDLFFCASLTPTNVRGVASPCSRRRRRRRRQVNIIIQYMYTIWRICVHRSYACIYIYMSCTEGRRKDKKDCVFNAQPWWGAPGGRDPVFTTPPMLFGPDWPEDFLIPIKRYL